LPAEFKGFGQRNFIKRKRREERKKERKKLLNSAARKYFSSRSKSNSLASASIVEREENGPDHVLDVRAQDVLGVRGNKAIHSTGIPVTCIYCSRCTNHDNGT
jgi:hypothetical protein